MDEKDMARKNRTQITENDKKKPKKQKNKKQKKPINP